MSKSGVCIQPEIVGSSTLLQCGNDLLCLSFFQTVD